MFTTEGIEKHINQSPFIPIRVVMSSGQTHDIVDPRMVLVGRQSMTIGTPSADNPGHYEHIATVSLMHISSVLLIQTAPPPGSNGQQNP